MQLSFVVARHFDVDLDMTRSPGITFLRHSESQHKLVAATGRVRFCSSSHRLSVQLHIMPRKSLAATVAAETAPSPKSTSHSSRKSRKSLALATALDPSSPDPIAPSPEVELGRSSRKRGRKHVDEPEDLVGVLVESNGVAQPQSSGGAAEPGQEFTLEQQLEAWQDFAAEHYEMVEQLPLELHRNFRLLRELDDGCMGELSAERSGRGRERADVDSANEQAGGTDPGVYLGEDGAGQALLGGGGCDTARGGCGTTCR